MSYTTETPSVDDKKTRTPKKIVTTTFQRKPFDVEAVLVTEENFEDIAAWTDGKIITVTDAQTSMPLGVKDQRYIQVDVNRPLTPRQAQAHVGDYVVYASRGFKIYANRTFHKNFEEKDKPQELMVTDEPAGVGAEAINPQDYSNVEEAAKAAVNESYPAESNVEKTDIPQAVNNVEIHHHYHGDAQPGEPVKIQHENHQVTEPAPIASEPGPVQSADGGNWGGHS